ncbi:hypothetical protein HOM13_02150 [Candidatus Woesearchaeota archaeon]|nr:hypothetical protein [Candidatus Woesearchaeota archaeon]MBT5215516.1 hypothetical protein [Candidatus Woesearchaeota archaeon]MBT6402237.1 hypothetical protein [Candidatus Woesearchaeota archaeon]
MTLESDPKNSNKAPLDKKAQEEIKKKFEQMKSKVDLFKKKIIAKKDNDVVGICVLPPEKFEDLVNRLRNEKLSEEELRKRIKSEQQKINVLVLVDDQEKKKTEEKIELIKKTEEFLKKSAESVDKLIKSQCMLMSELREACFDGKYEVMKLLATGVHLYDPKDVLGALKVSEIHKSMVLQRFERYIVSYVAVGSVFRGDASSHDIDVAIIIDDTDVKRMSRAELRDKLMSIIRSMGYEASAAAGVKKIFHIQVYILTDFWDGIRDATPVFFTFLRDGIPLYDRGVFMPQKLLLNMGRIKPSPEAIEMHMDVGERMIDRAKGKLITIVVEDLYYAALNPSQSALMLQGYPPSTPKETIQLMEDIFVKKEKLMKPSELNILKDAFKLYKAIEHGKIRDVTGREVDKMMENIRKYLKVIKEIVKKLEKKATKQQTSELVNSVTNLLEDLMKLENLPTIKSDLLKNFKKLVNKGHFEKRDLVTLTEILDISKKTISKETLAKTKRESSLLRKRLLRHIQRERGKEVDKVKIRVKYGEQFGDVYLLGENAYMVADIDAKTKAVSKAKINENGGLAKAKPSTMEELEKTLSSIKIPARVFIKEALFEDLKKIYGKDVHILVSN